jgi:hypothetical protein
MRKLQGTAYSRGYRSQLRDNHDAVWAAWC